MSKYRLFGLLLAFVLIWGCSNDDSPDIDDTGSRLPDFQVIGEDGSSIYKYTYAAAAEEGTTLDLTASNGVNRQYITLRQTGDLLSFFSFASDSFSVVLHDVVTSASLSYPNFYNVTDERAITWGSNSESQLFLGFYSPRGTRNYSVRIIDPETSDFTDVQVEFNTTRAFSPLYANGRLVLLYRDSVENYRLALLDTDNATLLQTLDFGSATTSIFLNNFDELVVLSSTDQSNYQYSVYDLQNLAVQEEGNFVLNKFFPGGPLEANLVDDKLFYLNFFAQPYPLTSGPAVFDLSLSEDRVIDMLGIVQQNEAELDNSIVLTDIHYLEDAELFAVGYAVDGPPGTWDGGMLFIRPDGQQIGHLELPFVPTYVVH